MMMLFLYFDIAEKEKTVRATSAPHDFIYTGFSLNNNHERHASRDLAASKFNDVP